MSMGMTYEEFWDGEFHLAVVYREKHRYELKQKNYDAWLQGLYIRNAVVSALNSKTQYFDKPLDVVPKNKRELEQEEENRRQRVKRTLGSLKSNWDRTHG